MQKSNEMPLPIATLSERFAVSCINGAFWRICINVESRFDRVGPACGSARRPFPFRLLLVKRGSRSHGTSRESGCVDVLVMAVTRFSADSRRPSCVLLSSATEEASAESWFSRL